jgi:hypothetical protein
MSRFLTVGGILKKKCKKSTETNLFEDVRRKFINVARLQISWDTENIQVTFNMCGLYCQI